MRVWKRLIQAIGAGAVAGGLVLGLLGRAAAAATSVAAGYPANLSVRGILTVVALGVVAGAAGGVVLHLMRRAQRSSGPVAGLVAGAAVFAGTLVLAWTGGRMVLTGNGPLPGTLAAAAVVCLIYGVAAEAFLSRFERRADVTTG